MMYLLKLLPKIVLYFNVVVPKKPPEIIHMHAPDNSSVSLNWTGLSDKHWQGALQGYKILYQEAKSDATIPYNVSMKHGADTSTVIKDLKPGTWYILRILAFNVYGDGPLSAPVDVATQEATAGEIL